MLVVAKVITRYYIVYMEISALDERLSGLAPPPTSSGGQWEGRWSLSPHTPREIAPGTLLDVSLIPLLQKGASQ